MPSDWKSRATAVTSGDDWKARATIVSAPPQVGTPEFSRMLQGSKATAASPLPVPPTSSDWRGVEGVKRGAKNLVGMVTGPIQTALTPPRDPAELAIALTTGPMGLYQKRATQAALEKGGEAVASYQRGDIPGAVAGGIEAATGLPTERLLRTAGADLPGAVAEMATTAGGMAALGRYGGPAAKKGAATVRIAGQEIAGAGKAPVLIAQRQRLARIADQESSYNQALINAKEQHGQNLQVYDEKVAEIKANHTRKIGEIEAGYTARVAKVQAEDAARAAERQQLVRQAEAVEARRGTITSAIKGLQVLILDNVKNAHEAARGVLDKRWDSLRGRVQETAHRLTGEDAKADAAPIYNAVRAAERDILRGVPESITLFRQILKELGIQEVVDTPEGITALPGEAGAPLSKTVDFDTARVQYSALGAKRYSGGSIPGNVKRAIAHVQGAVDGQIYKMTEPAGATAAYEGLKKDWATYSNDWWNMESVATGGSPLARIFQAEDPPFVSDQVLGKAGERLLRMTAAYKKHGASPELMAKLRQLSAEHKELTKVRVSGEVGKTEVPPPKFPSPPRIPEPPQAKAVKRPEVPPEVNPAVIRRDILERAATHRYGWWELLFPPYLLVRMAITSPFIREWLAKQPRRETPVTELPTPPSAPARP